MEINDRESALAWLRAWEDQPRRGILAATIEGIRTCIGLTDVRRCPQMAKKYREALEALQRSCT